MPNWSLRELRKDDFEVSAVIVQDEAAFPRRFAPSLRKLCWPITTCRTGREWKR